MRIAPNVEDLINNMVASGRYADASAVVEQAVALLRQRDHNERIIASVKEARRAVNRGESKLLTNDVVDQIWRRAEESERLGRPIDSDVRP